MTMISKAPHPSPDPLALDDHTPFEDCIEVVLPTSTRTPPARTMTSNSKNSTPRKSRVKPVVEIPSGRKRKRLDAEEIVVVEKRIRTPLADVSPATIRATFLANEALRRQREARKFVYRGDAAAPKLTRSGKVVGETKVGGEEVDEYGGGVETEEDDLGITLIPDESLAQPSPRLFPTKHPDRHKNAESVVPLPPSARPHVLRILSTLTAQNITSDPPPFVDEEKNEALQGLLNLLKGTVERGEGNSALVVGARGVGKTRVGLATSV